MALKIKRPAADKPAATTTKSAPGKKSAPPKKGGKKSQSGRKSGIRGSLDEDGEDQVFEQSRSQMLEKVLGAQMARYGNVVMSAASVSAHLCIGIEMPFPMQYLLQSNVLPLGCTIQIVGKHGSNKSSMTFEIARWFKQQYGLAYLVENESKYSPDFARSIIGYNDEETRSRGDVLFKIDSRSCDDWQSKLQDIVKDWKKIWGVTESKKKKKGESGGDESEPKRKKKADGVPNMPILLILDSLMGKLSQETQDKIQAAGHAERTFAEEARQITNFLKKFPEDIARWPFTFVAVNQLKLSKDPGAAVATRRKAGGAQMDFVESFELQMDKISTSKYVEEGDNYAMEKKVKRLKISVHKNSLGDDDRRIEANLVWRHRYHERTGTMRQYTMWDWAAATTDLLMSFSEGGRKGRVQEIVDIHETSGKRFWSKTLKVPKTDPLNAHDIGKKILQNPDIIRKLQKLFAIKRHRVFVPKVDYRKQLAEAEKLAHKMLKND